MRPDEQVQLEKIIAERTGELQKTHEETLKLLHFLQLENEKRKQSEIALKKAVSDLRESEQKFKTILNFSPNGIVLIDLEGKIREISEIGVELLGANSKQEILEKHYLHFTSETSENSKQIIKNIINLTISEGLTQENELYLVKLDGKQMLGNISTALIQDSDGKPSSYVVVFNDISQRKKQQLNQIHADRMANLGQMASGMSHEINQPMNIISMIMDKMLYDAKKGTTVDIAYINERADKIFENLTRIRNIIDHIRVFSRNQFDYIPTAFSINKGVENAISMFREQFKHMGIAMHVSLSKQLPNLTGNIYQFEQVIMNLLNNAKDAVLERKALEDEDFVPEIDIKTFKKRNRIHVEIIDNGVGVEEDKINEIMIPFFSTKEEGKGTGLGLSISYQIVKDMGGEIHIKSSTMSHTKFSLIFITNDNGDNG
ncbi:MAG: ATP-binding protein [Paludibacter sp.]|jgi:PAS domain S-box-containing protein|nr:PAS domain S-box protein [Bacteroidales bacterium]